MEEETVTFTPSSTSNVTVTADDLNEISATYDSTSNEVNVNGHLITNDGFYIADSNGIRINLGGGYTADGENEMATTWVPDMDVT